MYIGKNSNGDLVEAKRASKEDEYICPCCEQPLILRQGTIKVPHFAHKSGHECDAWYGEMSEWHRQWQEMFPIENREVVINCNGERHRADVCFGKYVVEFQNSPMSYKEFDKRTKFYTDAGYKLIWVFNLEDKEILLHHINGTYRWMRWSKTFKNFFAKNGKSLLYFQFRNIHTKCTELHRIDWLSNCKDGYSAKYFRVFYKGPFRPEQFVNYMKYGFM